jgi:hypothetical protein
LAVACTAWQEAEHRIAFRIVIKALAFCERKNSLCELSMTAPNACRNFTITANQEKQIDGHRLRFASVDLRGHRGAHVEEF